MENNYKVCEQKMKEFEITKKNLKIKFNEINNYEK